MILCRTVLTALGLSWVSAVSANSDCATTPGLESIYAEGWGIDQRNTRYQPRSSLSSKNAPSLQLKWSYGLASTTPRSYPLVTEDTIFVGDGGRGLVALDRETGCERWVFEHTGNISSAIVKGVVKGKPVLIFTDRMNGGVFAVDALSGTLIWHARVKDCLLYTSPSPRDKRQSRMPSSA